jgi:hypothetical protein
MDKQCATEISEFCSACKQYAPQKCLFLWRIWMYAPQNFGGTYLHLSVVNILWRIWAYASHKCDVWTYAPQNIEWDPPLDLKSIFCGAYSNMHLRNPNFHKIFDFRSTKGGITLTYHHSFHSSSPPPSLPSSSLPPHLPIVSSI